MDILLLGNYCHDTLVRSDGNLQVLGGSSSYISKAFAAAGVDYALIAKVGRDFLYHDQVVRPPIVSESHLTTHFFDSFELGERTSVLKAVGEAIFPRDLPTIHAKIGLACGVINEISPETLMTLRKQVDYLICDVQGLIRKVDEKGNLFHVHFSETPYFKMRSKIDVLKANLYESTFIDLKSLGSTCLVITDGPHGSRVIQNGEVTLVPSPPTKEVDATGAGDSYIAGFTIGRIRGLSLLESIRLGNQFGSRAVKSIGIPDFSGL